MAKNKSISSQVDYGEASVSGVKRAKKVIEQSATEYVDGLDLVGDEKNLMKRVVYNVYTWACNGKNKTEIAQYLTLSKKEFDELVHKYPEVLGAMVKGKEFANMLMSMSMYEMALGKKTTRRQVMTTEYSYDEDGNKVSKSVPVWIEEEIPPNVRFNALKFLMENQVPEVYGKMNKEKDENEYAKALMNMSDAEKKALMFIEKNEHIRTLEVKRQDAPIVETSDVEN